MILTINAANEKKFILIKKEKFHYILHNAYIW